MKFFTTEGNSGRGLTRGKKVRTVLVGKIMTARTIWGETS